MAEQLRPYPVVGPGPERQPDYVRVVRALSDRELTEEIAAGKGSNGYLRALADEFKRRRR